MKPLNPLALGVVLSLALAGLASADDGFTKPISYTWVATSCTSWHDAASALVAAAGDPYLIVVPTTDEERPWLILRRVESGSVYIPPEEPFLAELFPHLDGAAAQFSTIAASRFPGVLTVPGGGAVVTYRRTEVRKRSVRH